MNVKALSFIKNISYTISSNLISLFVSTLVILIIPKIIGVEDYGYWQLYLFYSSYVGFLHLGWNDGIYLRFGGEKYGQIDKKLFFSQFVTLLTSQIIIGMLICGFTFLFVVDFNRGRILQMVALAMIFVNSRLMLLYILQATNRIKEYARITMLDRIVYILLIIMFLILGIRDYKIMIFADLLGKFVSLVYSMILCKEIVFNKISDFYLTVSEMIVNISIGIKLMFSNIASILIIGVVRFGIENSWSMATFGKVSLTLSVSNLMMLFINAIGVIMFPILRRTDKSKLPSIYITMRDFLMIILLGALIIYYPLKVILSVWLPEYADSLSYMALVFPMCIYEGKMSLLINTYLKTLREEKKMLEINIVSLALAVFLAYTTTIVIRNLNLAILSITLLLAFRSALAEIYLSKILKISVYKDIILESIVTLIFIFTGWFVQSWISFILYIVTFGIYILIKKKDIIRTSTNLKLLLKA